MPVSDIDKKIQKKSDELRSLEETQEEIIENDELSERKNEFDKNQDKIDDLQEDLQRYKKHKEQQAQAREPQEEPVRDGPGVPADDSSSDQDLIESDEYRQAFQKYCKYGRSRLTRDQASVLQEGFEERIQESGVDDVGGYTVPQDMADEIDVAREKFGRVREANITEIETEGGGDLLIPTSDDTNNKGQIVGEGQSQNTNDINFGQKRLTAHLYSSDFVKVSLSLLQDTAFNMDSFIGSRLGERIGRIQAEHFTTGSGSNEPLGFVTECLNEGATVSAAASGSIDENDLIDLRWGVDPAYRPGQWMLHDDIEREILKITDGDNNHPFIEDFRMSQGMSQLFGDDVIENQEMDSSIASNNETMAYGNWSKFWVRDVQGFAVRRVEERFIDEGLVAFIGFARSDSTLVDAGTNPIKLLQH